MFCVEIATYDGKNAIGKLVPRVFHTPTNKQKLFAKWKCVTIKPESDWRQMMIVTNKNNEDSLCYSSFYCVYVEGFEILIRKGRGINSLRSLACKHTTLRYSRMRKGRKSIIKIFMHTYSKEKKWRDEKKGQQNEFSSISTLIEMANRKSLLYFPYSHLNLYLFALVI